MIMFRILVVSGVCVCVRVCALACSLQLLCFVFVLVLADVVVECVDAGTFTQHECMQCCVNAVAEQLAMVHL